MNDETSARGMLRDAASDSLIEAAFSVETRSAQRLGTALSIADLAHSIVLIEGDHVDAEVGAQLLTGLLELHKLSGDDFPWDPKIGDPFSNREHALKAQVGASAAGWLSAGRPRREALRIALRRYSLESTIVVQLALCDLIESIVAVAERHRDDVALDYTYLQPAQPSTLGHLLLAYAYPAMRDLTRLDDSVKWLYANVAGVGGTAGSRWNFDRNRLAQLLGCRSSMEHTKDAMWQTDGYVQLLSSLAIAMTNCSQIAQDFEIFASGEFGFIELSDSHSRESALMPQKKNPYALVAVRTQAASSTGDLTSALTVLHTGSARTDHFQLLNGTVPTALEATGSTIRLLADVFRELTIHSERVAQTAQRERVKLCASDLADVLAAQTVLDYRSAHTIVGQALRQILDDDRELESLSAADLMNTAHAELGIDVTIADSLVSDALDLNAALASRLQEGACAPQSVQTMIDDAREYTTTFRAEAESNRAQLATSAAALVARAQMLADNVQS